MAIRSVKKKTNPMRSPPRSMKLDPIHHVAISVRDIATALEWYTSRFQCRVEYVDDSWALLEFANAKLALVLPHEHPPHFAVGRRDANKFGELTAHRDGLHSVYITDPFANSIEILEER